MAEVFRILELEAARSTVLRRVNFEQLVVPSAVRVSIERVFGRPLSPAEAVDVILDDVRTRGDDAIRDYNRRIDGADTPDLEVSRAEMDQAWSEVPIRTREALQVAADRVRAFHERQYRQSWMDWESDGGGLGQIIRPLERVAVYAPGGRAPLPSSLLMAAVVAGVAGVPDVVVATPPGRDGRPASVILAASRVAGVRTVYRVGGAQAIAALSFGTRSIPAAAKIVGPGSLFTILAKRKVFGVVGIDGLPGPTETVVVADDGADPALVAADLLAQAEHDVVATPLCLTPSRELARRVCTELEKQGPALPLPLWDTVRESFHGRGAIIVTRDLAEAIDAANDYAPEHLCLLVRDAWAWVGRVRNAGGVFVGEGASEALGDYIVGPSHIMPTGGTARWASPCNVWDFVKITSVYAPSGATARRLAPDAAALARAEGLEAHARALEARG